MRYSLKKVLDLASNCSIWAQFSFSFPLFRVRFVLLHFFCFSIGRYASMQEASWNEIFAGLSAIQRPPFDFSMAENVIARCSGRFKLDPVEDVYVNGMFHSVCGLVTIRIFKSELGEITKMEGCMTFCNMVIEADGKNGVVPAYEFTFNYLEDKNSVGYEPVYSDKDVRYVPSSQKGIFLAGWATKKHNSIRLT